MAKVGKEGSNTEKMVKHQLLKKQHHSETFKHEEVDLIIASDLLDLNITELYNAAEGCTIAGFLQCPHFETPCDRRTLVSDTDNQLLIKLKFKQKVTVNSIILKCDTPPESEEEEYAPPGLIKIYCNHESLDFGDLDNTTPILVSNALESGKVALPSSKSQRVDTLYIFVAEGNPPEAPFTFINQLQVMGYQTPDYHASYQ